ncbi:MAG: hypothetical protein JWM61_220 [Micrococcaceae bacterium]|jgi:hypothetical protein|nr:hypothetical protein [Micrococcaceae bacterium]
MLVGYMRVSKSDGSQTTDPQRDACSKPASTRPDSTRTSPQARRTTAPDWPRA